MRPLGYRSALGGEMCEASRRHFLASLRMASIIGVDMLGIRRSMRGLDPTVGHNT